MWCNNWTIISSEIIAKLDDVSVAYLMKIIFVQKVLFCTNICITIIECGGLSYITYLLVVLFLFVLLFSFTGLYIILSLILFDSFLCMLLYMLNIDSFQEIFEILKLTESKIFCNMFLGWLECLLILADSSLGFLQILWSFPLNQNNSR